MLFIGPPDQDADWTDEGVEGVYRFLEPALAPRRRAGRETAADDRPPRTRGRRPRARCARRTGRSRRSRSDMAGRFAFNTAIARGDGARRTRPTRLRAPAGAGTLRFAAGHRRLAALPLRAAHRRGRLRAADGPPRLGGALAGRRPGAARARRVEIVCQVNGSVRDRVQAAAGAIATRSSRALPRRAQRAGAHGRTRDRQGDRRAQRSSTSSCGSASARARRARRPAAHRPRPSPRRRPTRGSRPARSAASSSERPASTRREGPRDVPRERPPLLLLASGP